MAEAQGSDKLQKLQRAIAKANTVRLPVEIDFHVSLASELSPSTCQPKFRVTMIAVSWLRSQLRLLE